MTTPGAGSCADVGRKPDCDAPENAANSATSPGGPATPIPPTAWPFLKSGTPPGLTAVSSPSIGSNLPVMIPRPVFAPSRERAGLMDSPGLKLALSGQPRFVFSIPYRSALGAFATLGGKWLPQAYMGVEVHANVIDNLLHSGEPGRSLLTRGAREEMIDVAFILVFGLGLGLWFGRVPPLYSTLSLLLVLGVFGWFVYFAFAHWGRWLSFVIPAGTLVANYAAITSFRMIFEEREKRKIRKTFSQYLSPGVIALIEKDPQKYI